MTPNPRPPRAVSAVSLVLFSSLILAYLWSWRFSYFHTWLAGLAYLGCGLLVAGTHWWLRDFRLMGLQFQNFKAGIAGFGLPAAGVSGLLIIAGLRGGEWNQPSWKMVLPYLGWALVQQHVLQNFLRFHVENLLGGRGWPVWTLSGLLFAVFHLPNPWLVSLTFVMGLVWCALFSRTPNLLAAALGQTLLTVTLAAFFKFGFVGQFEVGLTGFRFEHYGDGVKVAAGYLPSDSAFVATLPGANRGRSSQVRVFNSQMKVLAEWVAFPEFDFSGEIAAGDLGYGPGDEIVVTPGPEASNPPLARVFNARGELLDEFRAEWLGTGYGAWPEIHCGRLYLGAGPGPRRPQRLVEVAAGSGVTGTWEFPDLGLANGLRGLRLCDTPAHQAGDLLVWASDISTNPANVYRMDAQGRLLLQLKVFETTFGLQLTLLDGPAGTLLAGAPGPLPGYPGMVSVRDLAGAEISRLSVFVAPESCGANLAAVDWDGDGRDELVAGEGNCPARPARVQIRTLKGDLLASWEAY